MLNQIMLQGRLVKDPELNYTNNGDAYVSFTVAVDRNYKDKNSGERPTDFIDCKAWSRTAETIAQHFMKGAEILLDGELRQNRWTNQQGQKRSRKIVRVNNFYFTSGSNTRNSGGGRGQSAGPQQRQQQPQQQAAQPAQQQTAPPPPEDDFDEDFDVPF